MFDDNKAYTVEEIAEKLRLSPITIKRRIYAGKLKAFKDEIKTHTYTRGWKAKGSDIKEYLEKFNV